MTAPWWGSIRGARALFQAMEQGSVKDPGALVAAFQQSLLARLDDPATDAFLSEVEAALRAPPGGADLWALAVERFGDERAALAALAPLFQDLGPMGGHIMRVITNPALASYHPKAMRLAGICAQIAAAPAAARTLVPPRFRDAPELRAYHFLVMAEAAARMRAQGFPARTAALASYSLNTAYEIYQRRFATKDQPDGITVLMQKPVRAALEALLPSDGKTFDRNDTGGLSDLYLGYAGAAFGAGVAGIDDFRTFAEAFSSSPQGYGERAFRASPQ